jgi:D-alanyl-lipoteichoic acid acyltransferase DltB (MBOAT superfamily)
MVDAVSERWDRPLNPWSYFNYTCGFLTLVSGPIQRYQDFLECEQRIAVQPDQTLVDRGFERLIIGFVKVLVVSATANYVFLHIADHILNPQHEVLSWSELCIYYFCAAIAYTGYLYYNFAGYMDIVIGMGRLFNWDLPENFNKPFAARSFLEFWNRWHMTLSGWFKIYLFTPLMMFLTARFPSPATLPYLGVFGFFFTFFVVGIWHGTTPIFLLCGVLMGLGASINKLWQVRMLKSLGKKKYQQLARHPAYIYLCRGLTFSYFTMAVVTCFWVDLSQMAMLVDKIGAVGVAGIFVAMTFSAALGAVVWDLCAAFCRMTADRLAAFENVVTRNMYLATLIVLIVFVSSFYHKAPDFVYRAF